jgi:hypothetical protein
VITKLVGIKPINISERVSGINFAEEAGKITTVTKALGEILNNNAPKLTVDSVGEDYRPFIK